MADPSFTNKPLLPPTRRDIRRLIDAILKTDSSLEGFCIDYFVEIQRSFSTGMDRETKVNLLLSRSEPSDVLERLTEADADAVLRNDHLLQSTKRSLERLGDYELLNPVGQGGSATVYKARHVGQGSTWAVKRMHQQIMLSNPDSKRRFEQEAILASSIDNPHIVKVITAGVDSSGVPWLAMEMLKGETLGSYLMQHPNGLAFDEARSIFKQLCFGLAAAHERSIVHRDLKPENIFLAATGLAEGPERIVKILDFGLSKVVEESQLGQSSVAVGTSPWMAPEQYDFRLPVEPACDVWSLGLIAFKLFTGRHYFLAADANFSANPAYMFREIMNEPLALASARAAHYGCRELVPAGFDTWLGGCLIRDAKGRFAHAAKAYRAFVDTVVSPREVQPAGPPPAPLTVAPPQPPAEIHTKPTLLPRAAARLPAPPLAAAQPTPAQKPPVPPVAVQPNTAQKLAASAPAIMSPQPSPPHLGVSLRSLLERADELYLAKDWAGAFKLYETVIDHHRERLSDSEATDSFYSMGIAKLRLGAKKMALIMFEKVLEINAFHRATLREVIELQSAQRNWEKVIIAKRALLAGAQKEERFNLHCEMAELYSDKLQDHNAAIQKYLEALEIKPESAVTLHKILDLYTKTEQWHKAIEILMRVAGLERDPLQRGKFHYTVGVIYRDALRAGNEAIIQFSLALDNYFAHPERIPADRFQECLKPFEAMEKIYIERNDWKPLELSHLKMIANLPKVGQEAVTLKLLHNLSEIYRVRLGDSRSAIQTLEIAVQLEPNNAERRKALTNLYIESGPDYYDKLVAEQQFLIKKHPYRIESYRVLRRIYLNSRQYDKAWCMCSALVCLNDAEAEETQFFEQHRRPNLVSIKAELTSEMWIKYIYHPDQDLLISQMCAALYFAAGLSKSMEYKHYGLKRKDRRDLATEQSLLGMLFKYLMQVLHTPSNIELYFRPEGVTLTLRS